MKKLIAVPVLGIALAIGLTGCGKHSSAPAKPLTASQQAEKKTAEAYVNKCIPQSSVAQIQLAHQLSNAADRAKLEQCLGIPKDQRQNFEGSALGDAEHINWNDKSARSQFFDVTLPNLAMSYQNKN